MKNILGHYGDLKLFGSCGELRYFYFSTDMQTCEILYDGYGYVEKKTITDR